MTIETSELKTRLTDYLGSAVSRLGLLASGWETTVYEFAVERSVPRFRLPGSTPLVLRFYDGGGAEDKGTREYRSMRQLSAAGYRVPKPYLYERDRGPLGVPFLVMDRMRGGPLFAIKAFPPAFKTFSLGFLSFVRTQTALHKLDPRSVAPEGVPQAFSAGDAPAGSMPLLDRVLHTVADRVERGPLPYLRDALEWARGRAAIYSEARPSLVHMDYHPQNVLVSGVHVTGVIDWVNADLGDRHLDAATTAVILATSSMEKPRWMRDNAAGNTLRALFAMLYFPAYHALAPVELDRFRYCQAVAALTRLSMLGMMRARGPESVGFRADAIEQVTPSVLRLLSRYLSHRTGLAIRPPMPPSAA
jgi:aminoglycoside phosphotransferase (APT) family kinase protein